MKRRRWVLVGIAALGVGLLQASFFSILPTPWRELQPVLPFATILVVLHRPRAALVFAAIAGFAVDLFSPGASRFAYAEYLLIAAAVAFLSETVLTNRSVYAAAALAAVARGLSRLWDVGVSAVSAVLFKTAAPFEPAVSFLITLGWDLAVVATLFFLLAHFTRRFLITVSRDAG